MCLDQVKRLNLAVDNIPNKEKNGVFSRPTTFYMAPEGVYLNFYDLWTESAIKSFFHAEWNFAQDLKIWDDEEYGAIFGATVEGIDRAKKLLYGPPEDSG
jgi:hypothetical protein